MSIVSFNIWVSICSDDVLLWFGVSVLPPFVKVAAFVAGFLMLSGSGDRGSKITRLFARTYGTIPTDDTRETFSHTRNSRWATKLAVLPNDDGGAGA